ncbi:MAG: hypoxanthine phosphoribosyltransferase [Oscillospiraceae bacterium]|nr:hypoxanthine phosphoribosyltransferase [Oscillospiraceae bacterium]
MHRDVERVLYTEEALKERITELGKRMTADYQGKNPVFIGVLKGSFMFMADLMRTIDLPCEVEFMAVSSYGNKSETTGAVRITQDLDMDIENRHAIIVEDILDSGLTLNYLINYLNGSKPASIEICTLLDKPERRRAQVNPKYTGFTIPDAFVVGYGLDFAQRYRNLPYIGILKPEVYQ